jgi:YfiH family protein
MPEYNAIIRSEILLRFPEITHGISTKIGGNPEPPYYNNMSFKVGDDEENVRSNRDKFFGALGIDQKLLAIPQQVHSDEIQIIGKPGYYTGCDGLITSSKNVYLIISTADCYGVLMYDAANKVIANIHSGWRGTQKKIITKAINLMKKKFGTRSEDMHVFVGPGISKENFEVGGEVAKLFEEKYVLRKNGKYFVDLKSNISDQLNAQSIVNSHLEIYPRCSYNMKDYLHSYRRDRGSSGRMYSVIGMRS